MPRARLLAVVMLVSLCAGQLFAQSQRNDNSGVISSRAISSNTSSSNPAADLFRLDPDLKVWFATPSSVEKDATGANHVDEYAHPSSQDSSQLRVRKFTTEMRPPFDATCYAIRSYLVVRDSPHSDVTHRDGSTTCVPAARVRIYSSTIDQKR